MLITLNCNPPVHKSISNIKTLGLLFSIKLHLVLQTWDNDEHVRTTLQMLLDIGSAAPTVPVHWRFSLMANSLLLVLLPPSQAPAAHKLALHFFPHLSDPLPAQRSLAAAFFVFMLTGDHAWKTVSPSPFPSNFRQNCLPRLFDFQISI